MCLPARSSICGGQATSGSSSATSTARVAKGAIGSVSGATLLIAHPVEPDRARPGSESDGCSGPRGRPARPAPAPAGRHSGRPARHWRHGLPTATGRRRRLRHCPAKGVERVFDDVVTGRADDMQEQLAGEFGQTKARADLAAVDHDRAGCRPAALAPFGEDFAVVVEQGQPAGDRLAP